MSEFDFLQITEISNEFEVQSNDGSSCNEFEETNGNFYSNGEDSDSSLPALAKPKRRISRDENSDNKLNGTASDRQENEDSSSSDEQENEDSSSSDEQENEDSSSSDEQETGINTPMQNSEDNCIYDGNFDDGEENGNGVNDDKNEDIEETGNLDVINDSESDNEIMEVGTIAIMFEKKAKKLGLSQRFLAKHVLKCTQSTISEVLSKAKRIKTSKDLTPRGKLIYEKMEKWLASEEEQKRAQKLATQQRAYSSRSDKPRVSGKKATKFTAVQMAVLVKLFRKDNKPSAKKQQLIAETLSLNTEQVRTWFNNQRARNFPAGKEAPDNIPEELDTFVNNFYMF